MEEPGRTQGVFENRFPSAGGNESSNRPWRQQVGNTCGTVVYSYCPAGVFFIIRAVYWFMGGKDMTGTDFTGEHLIGESRTGESHMGESRTGESHMGESHMGESRTRKFHTGKRRRIKHHTVKYDSKKYHESERHPANNHPADSRTAGHKDTAMHVSKVSIAVNVVLTCGKLAAGILGRSHAMISDAVHSASDVFSTLIVMAGVSMSAKQSDKEHPYGHERLECVAALFLAVILCATGLGIGFGAVREVVSGEVKDAAIPGLMALAAAIVSIVVKEWMYRYTIKAADSIHSSALKADAWHHRSDALSSVGAFVGICGARMGFAFMDPAASIVICIFICKASLDVLRDALDKMVDKACDEKTAQAIRRTALAPPGVVRIDGLKTRLFGPRMYVDIEIAVDGRLNLQQAHTISREVHDMVEEQFPQVKHCAVQINPLNREG
jgi:cation diffusion facilitator family transporter